MKHLSNHSRTIGAALSLAMFAAAVPAHAVERNQIIILSPGQLQNLNSRERRLDYQQRQQINREQDSKIVIRPQRLEVPVMKPRCPLQTSGTPRTC